MMVRVATPPGLLAARFRPRLHPGGMIAPCFSPELMDRESRGPFHDRRRLHLPLVTAITRAKTAASSMDSSARLDQHRSGATEALACRYGAARSRRYGTPSRPCSITARCAASCRIPGAAGIAGVRRCCRQSAATSRPTCSSGRRSPSAIRQAQDPGPRSLATGDIEQRPLLHRLMPTHRATSGWARP